MYPHKAPPTKESLLASLNPPEEEEAKGTPDPNAHRKPKDFSGGDFSAFKKGTPKGDQYYPDLK